MDRWKQAPWRRILVLVHNGFVGRRIVGHLRAAFPDAELAGHRCPREHHG